jgi:Flp pilus assembly protein TadD
MDAIESADRHILNAVQGWLELGNSREALAEFERLSPGLQTQPEGLALRWRILAAQKDWARGLEVARRLIAAAPDDPAGWIHQSYCLHELKRTEEAWNQLLAVASRFSEIPTVAYNLACYACRMGRPAEARPWLRAAAKLVGRKRLREMARDDADLAPMREEIENLEPGA